MKTRNLFRSMLPNLTAETLKWFSVQCQREAEGEKHVGPEPGNQ